MARTKSAAKEKNRQATKLAGKPKAGLRPVSSGFHLRCSVGLRMFRTRHGAGGHENPEAEDEGLIILAQGYQDPAGVGLEPAFVSEDQFNDSDAGGISNAHWTEVARPCSVDASGDAWVDFPDDGGDDKEQGGGDDQPWSLRENEAVLASVKRAQTVKPHNFWDAVFAFFEIQMGATSRDKNAVSCQYCKFLQHKHEKPSSPQACAGGTTPKNGALED